MKHLALGLSGLLLVGVIPSVAAADVVVRGSVGASVTRRHVPFRPWRRHHFVHVGAYVTPTVAYGPSYVPPQPSTYVPPYYGPSYVAPTPPPEKPFRRLGLGVFAGATGFEDETSADDLGVLAKYRMNQMFALEGELSQSESELGSLSQRAGVGLRLQFGEEIYPYGVVGLGAIATDTDEQYSFGEIGGGIGFAITDQVAIELDVRSGQMVSEDDAVEAAYARARAAVVAHF